MSGGDALGLQCLKSAAQSAVRNVALDSEAGNTVFWNLDTSGWTPHLSRSPEP